MTSVTHPCTAVPADRRGVEQDRSRAVSGDLVPGRTTAIDQPQKVQSLPDDDVETTVEQDAVQATRVVRDMPACVKSTYNGIQPGTMALLSLLRGVDGRPDMVHVAWRTMMHDQPSDVMTMDEAEMHFDLVWAHRPCRFERDPSGRHKPPVGTFRRTPAMGHPGPTRTPGEVDVPAVAG